VSRDSELDQNLSGDLQKILSSDLNDIWYVGRGRWLMHDGMPYGRIQGQGQGHSREVDRQSPTGLILYIVIDLNCVFQVLLVGWFIDCNDDIMQTLDGPECASTVLVGRQKRASGL